MRKENQSVKRVLSFIMVFAMMLTLLPTMAFANETETTTVYFVPSSEWKADNAWFAVWAWADNQEGTWYTLTDTDSDGYLEAQIPIEQKNVIFCRMSPNFTDPAWDAGNDDHVWTQTGDLKIENGNNCYTVSGWSDGAWSSYTPSTGEGGAASTATYIIAGSEQLCGSSWSTTDTANAMTLNDDGLYEKTYESVAVGTHSFKVTDGTWDKAWPENNYELTLDAISDVTITFNAETKEIKVSSEATGEVPPAPVESVTIHYRNTGIWSDVYWHAWIENGDSDTGLNDWPGKKLTEKPEGTTNWYTLKLDRLNAANGIGVLFNNGSGIQTSDIMITESGEYWYDGELLTAAPADTWPDGTAQPVSQKVTMHFANTQNWGVVNLYTWGAYSNGSWPGTKAGLDSDGFYSMSFEYEGPEGQDLKFIYNNGSSQTVDLVLPWSAFTKGEDGFYSVERWVVPTTTDSEGKYYADIVDAAEAIAISPVVNGTSVTFQYKGSSTDTVHVYGSMNSWLTGYQMTCNDYGVWSVTLDNVSYGIHEYKFVVNGAWIADDLNGWQQNGNSAFLISDPSKDTNTVTINVHYDAPSTEWNVCAWGADGLEPQYDFTNDVATITLDGRASQYVAFKVRKSIEGNDWAEQSGEIRVDLANTVSGTIDVYVGSDFSVSQSLNADVVYANKVSSVELDYDNNTITIQTTKTVNDTETAFAIYKNGEKADIIESITTSGSTYTLTLTKTLDLITLYQYSVRFAEQVKFTDYEYPIGINTVYASDKFAAEYTYTGTDLGANWTANSTEFVVWAPTAAAVSVNLYESGTAGTADLIKSVEMTKDVNGTWVATVEGDLNGTYYTYAVTVDGKTIEAVDPYARTTGVNGQRGMVIDLDSTDPEGWDKDTNPNPLTSYTDAIIYELHVRDFSIDDSSGVSEANRGKYLAFTEEGTTTANGVSTGIDYLKELGITHLHLLPVYDYGSVDETKCDTFNWGYDPVNYNTPEGSYSTDPYNGATRVEEFKEMVMALHEADISVIMDVVYNHVYDAGKFCMNQIVPTYFSRVNADGSYSNGSGCGNDTASEREMVRKYIVESVMYWKEEYHIDGFRFDLVGLLDETTINEIVDTVHAKYPDVIFYGEGWALGTAVEPGNDMATQANSAGTPDFAYFSDTIRNLLGGSNGTSLGFASGLTGQEEAVANNFMARPWWTSNPTQIIQYVSCHDNYTLIDKLVLSTGKSGIDTEIIKMNNLAAAIYMTSQGIPFIHAGEEFLREKLEEDGTRCENSYNASDYVNHIEWSNLEKTEYADTSAYYQGLIAFRKAHAALRLGTKAEIDANVKYTWITNEVVMFTIDGTSVADETHNSIVVIFNANKAAKNVALPEGEWSVCIDAEDAGTEVLYTASGTVSVEGISAMVLVQGEKPESNVKNEQTGVTYETLSDALSATKSGETLQLLNDVTVNGTVMVSNDVTLDLNGNTLDTDYIVVFNGSSLVDKSTEKGLLKVARDNISLPVNNAQMPVWNAADGYIFTAVNLSYEEMVSEEGYVFKSKFKPSFGKLGNEKQSIAKTYFLDEKGASDNGLKIILRLSWETDSGKVTHEFEYNDSLVQTVYKDAESKTFFTLGVTKLATDSDVAVNVVIISDTGVETVSAGCTYQVG